MTLAQELIAAPTLLAHWAQAGFARCEPPILQPAAVFLDLSGEDLRGKLYFTSDADGAELCLRPEYTIPVCRAWLAASPSPSPAQFAYCGPVFRHASGAPTQFTQAGLESFGRTDRAAADAEILALTLTGAQNAGSGELAVTFGDAALFSRLIAALDLTPPWQRRIMRGHLRGHKLTTIFEQTTQGEAADHSGVVAALEGTDKQGARALVEDLLRIAGISSVGGRSPGEIADRFLEQASLRASGAFPAAKREVIERFLAIEGEPDAAFAQMRALAKAAHLNFDETFADFDARLGFFSAHGLPLRTLHFSAGFVRSLDYYTGFMFEARNARNAIIGGGRYDTLLARLNGGTPVPAVGAAIFMDRLLERGA